MTDLDQALALPGVEASILATPTPIHAAQAIQCLKAGVHVEVEIPLADNWLDAQAVDGSPTRKQAWCMVGHTRRFNPSHQWVYKKFRLVS